MQQKRYRKLPQCRRTAKEKKEEYKRGSITTENENDEKRRKASRY